VIVRLARNYFAFLPLVPEISSHGSRQSYGDLPPAAIKTIRDLIYYQYAKIIAQSAGLAHNFRFIMGRVTALKKGEIQMSDALREIKRQLKDEPRTCEFCGSDKGLSFDHIVPHSKGGPDSAENLVLACKHCNSSKSSKGLYEWYGLDRKDELPRIVAGKYLKLLYEIHDHNGTLEEGDLRNDGELNVLDLEVY